MKAGRMRAERCIGLLQNLALAMQDHPKGRAVQVARNWAARAIVIKSLQSSEVWVSLRGVPSRS